MISTFFQKSGVEAVLIEPEEHFSKQRNKSGKIYYLHFPYRTVRILLLTVFLFLCVNLDGHVTAVPFGDMVLIMENVHQRRKRIEGTKFM